MNGTSARTAAQGGAASAVPEQFAIREAEFGGTALEEIQRALESYGVRADVPEIANALLVALAARPALCRGLFASYLLGGSA